MSTFPVKNAPDCIAVYKINHPATATGVYYVGRCKLSRLANFSDARKHDRMKHVISHPEFLEQATVEIVWIFSEWTIGAEQWFARLVNTTQPNHFYQANQRFERHGNCKQVRCIDDGEIFASVKELAEHLEVVPNYVSTHLRNRVPHKIRGKTYEYV